MKWNKMKEIPKIAGLSIGAVEVDGKIKAIILTDHIGLPVRIAKDGDYGDLAFFQQETKNLYRVRAMIYGAEIHWDFDHEDEAKNHVDKIADCKSIDYGSIVIDILKVIDRD
jgi:hypothetical protein